MSASSETHNTLAHQGTEPKVAPSLPHQQHISNVLARDGGIVVAGTVHGNITFGSNDNEQKATEAAASACRTALFLIDPSVQRERIINTKGRRVAGTCEWITQNDTFRAWLDGRNNFIWVSGGPGKGKTMMSIFLTEELERLVPTRANTESIFCFCGHQDEKCNTAVTVLRGLIHQLISKRPGLLKHASPYFNTLEKSQQALTSLETLWIIFRNIVEDPDLGNMFCILDGLDECDEGSLAVLVPKLIQLLADGHAQKSATGFKLAIISRDMHGLQSVTRIKLDPDNDEKVISDIQRFITTRIDELSYIEGFNEDVRATVYKALKEGAAGTFLWVGFTMHELLQKRTCTELLEALGSSPKGLPAMYERMLLRIPPEKKHVSALILRWVTLAFQPLPLQDLAAAISLRPSHPHISLEQTARDAISLCGPFLVLKNEKAVKVERRLVHRRFIYNEIVFEHQVVSLVHQSARDYLLRTQHEVNSTLKTFTFESRTAHFELAQTCLNTLTQTAMRHKDFETNGFRDIDEPLLQYAIRHWPDHAKHCSDLSARLFNPKDFFFDKHSKLRIHWWNSYPKHESNMKDGSILLHTMCYLGITPLVDAIMAKRGLKLKLSKGIDDRNDFESTALHWAAIAGKETEVRTLIDKGASVKAKDKHEATPLLYACSENFTAVAQVLIQRGSDVRAMDYRGRTALYHAARHGNEQMSRLLLKQAVDIKAKTHDKETALHAAVRGGNLKVVSVMLDFGADIESKDGSNCTVLQQAIRHGPEDLVRLLLRRGAKVKDSYLTSAVGCGRKELVLLLLENGAKVENSAVYEAARGGYTELARLVLEKGADIEYQDGNGWTALQAAAQLGFQTTAELLLERGADINSKNNDGRNALHVVAMSGEKEIAQLFLQKGADVNAQNQGGETALSIAVWFGKKEIAQLLLEEGADVDRKDIHGQTALHIAVKYGRKEIAQLLLEKGADVDSKGRDGQNALHIAAALGDVTMVQMLLQKGTNVNVDDMGALLHHAVRWNSVALVQLLLEMGANVRAIEQRTGYAALDMAYERGYTDLVLLLIDREATNEYCSALHRAVRTGSVGLAGILLERGVDVHEREEGYTALYLAVKGGYLALTKLLLDKGADPMATVGKGHTALHIAAAYNPYATIARVLVERGSDIQAKNDNGCTALQVASYNDNWLVHEYLKSLEEPPTTE